MLILKEFQAQIHQQVLPNTHERNTINLQFFQKIEKEESLTLETSITLILKPDKQFMKRKLQAISWMNIGTKILNICKVNLAVYKKDNTS